MTNVQYDSKPSVLPRNSYAQTDLLAKIKNCYRSSDNLNRNALFIFKCSTVDGYMSYV